MLKNDWLTTKQYIVTYLLKARIAEPEMSVARQWLCKHVSTATDSHDHSNRYMNGTTEKLLEAVFTMWSIRTLHKELVWTSPASCRRRRKGNPVPGPACSWGMYIQGPGPPGWGSVESERVKYGHQLPWDSDLRMVALARASSNCKYQTCPLVREGTSHQQTRNCLTVIKIWSWATDGCLTPRKTGRLTVSHNIILTVTSLKPWMTVLAKASNNLTDQLKKKPCTGNIKRLKLDHGQA
jgi:hypothetical protein